MLPTQKIQFPNSDSMKHHMPAHTLVSEGRGVQCNDTTSLDFCHMGLPDLL